MKNHKQHPEKLHKKLEIKMEQLNKKMCFKKVLAES